MYFGEPIPDSEIEQVELLQSILIDRATGGDPSDPLYRRLRNQLREQSSELWPHLPDFVRSNRSLDSFWHYIKHSAPTYAERREIIYPAFAPALDHLEGRTAAPGDDVTSSALRSFDADGVQEVWSKALGRRKDDPEGAITVARTLLETVTKRILDETGTEYKDSDDLPKLYAKTAAVLNLAPSQHTEEPIKAILGGAMNMVNGIGTLRNRLSDAHGRGGPLPVRPSERHASLAVNTAGAVATFLVETHKAKNSS